jgi:hypothetical protein
MNPRPDRFPSKLKEIAKLQDAVITGLDKALWKENILRLDNIRID